MIWNILIKSLLLEKFGTIGRTGFEGEGRLGREEGKTELGSCFESGARWGGPAVGEGKPGLVADGHETGGPEAGGGLGRHLLRWWKTGL